MRRLKLIGGWIVSALGAGVLAGSSLGGGSASLLAGSAFAIAAPVLTILARPGLHDGAPGNAFDAWSGVALFLIFMVAAARVLLRPSRPLLVVSHVALWVAIFICTSWVVVEMGTRMRN